MEPMLTVEWLDGPPPDLAGVQALLFTSANGVRAFARRTAARDIPALAVGDATAQAARAAGFTAVDSASGDVYALASLAAARCRPDAGVLLHVAGTTVAGDLSGQLAAAGFAVRRESLYDTLPARSLSGDTVRELVAGTVTAALFFSPRTARAFASLLDAGRLAPHCRTVDALCLSPAVADALRTPGLSPDHPWRSVRTARYPRQDELLALLGDAGDPG